MANATSQRLVTVCEFTDRYLMDDDALAQFNELNKGFAGEPDADATAESLMQAMAAGASFLVARLGGPNSLGPIVGKVTVTRAPLDSGYYYMLIGLVVNPAFRGQGIGMHLVLAAQRSARDDGAEFLNLWVDPANRAAIKTYERLGWRPNGYAGMSQLLVYRSAGAAQS